MDCLVGKDVTECYASCGVVMDTFKEAEWYIKVILVFCLMPFCPFVLGMVLVIWPVLIGIWLDLNDIVETHIATIIAIGLQLWWFIGWAVFAVLTSPPCC
jgi:hypothetical protein